MLLFILKKKLFFKFKFSSLLLIFSIYLIINLQFIIKILNKVNDVDLMLKSYRDEFDQNEKVIRINVQNLLSTISFIKTRKRRFDLDELQPSLNSLCTCKADNLCPPGRQGKRGSKGVDGINGKPGGQGLPGLPGNFPPVNYNFVQKCRICPRGERGEQGSPGAPGLPGLEGLNGKEGKNGEPGSVGPIGAPGQPGPQGVQGQTGSKGEPGNAAIIGEKGDPGSKGKQGRGGRRGTRGRDGIKGKQGQIGEQGLPGVPGKRGRKGAPGNKGPQGLQGPPGPDGLYCPCPKQSAHKEVVRSPGYGPDNPFGRRRPVQGKRRIGKRIKLEHSHDVR